MKKLSQWIRTALLLAALVVTALAFAPGQADAWKSCEYYCGPAGPYSCPYSPGALNCTWEIAW